jgi:hypothetical protein
MTRLDRFGHLGAARRAIGAVAAIRARRLRTARLLSPKASAPPAPAALLVFRESSHGSGVIASGVRQQQRPAASRGCI